MVRQLAVSCVLALLAAIYVRTFLVQAFRVPSPSMEPTLEIGDHILVNVFLYGGERWAGSRRWRAPRWLPMRAPRRGEVVVFRFPLDPRQRYVKRCLGRPGETVELDGGRLAINGRPLAEPYLAEPYLVEPSGADRVPRVVPSQSWFCLGDHRANSSDSRDWGSVPASRLVGRAVLVYLRRPPRHMDGVSSWDSSTSSPSRRRRSPAWIR